MGGTPSRDLATKSFPMQPSMRSLDARQVWPPCVAAAASVSRGYLEFLELTLNLLP